MTIFTNQFLELRVSEIPSGTISEARVTGLEEEEVNPLGINQLFQEQVSITIPIENYPKFPISKT